MAINKIPIQRGVRTRVFTRTHLGIIFTRAAVITLAAYLSATRHIRLTGKSTTTGVQGHTRRVG